MFLVVALAFGLVFTSCVHLRGRMERRFYVIRRATGPIRVDGVLDEEDWMAARPVGPFVFNWWRSGEKEQTTAKMLWDDGYLYVSFYCYDRHISAYVTRRHGPVSKDDCVEVFVAPNPKKVHNYYTFEINCIGTMLNRCKADWWTGPSTWDVEGVLIGKSVKGRIKEESPDDRFWVIELAIPLEAFRHDAAHIPPRHGDRWRLNLNRCGGRTNPQFSTWSPVHTPRPDFHVPEDFGEVMFSEESVRRKDEAYDPLGPFGGEPHLRKAARCNPPQGGRR